MKRSLILFSVLFLAIATSAQFKDAEVPAYHPNPPAKGEKLPPIATPEQVRTQMQVKYPFQVRAYEAAAKIPKVLYQLPCYCYCDREAGHKSLHSCFEGDHGAHCSTCLQEAFYAYKMTKLGKTPKQIREGVMKGEYKTIDLHQMDGPIA